jgi:hypothetical protein
MTATQSSLKNLIIAEIKRTTAESNDVALLYVGYAQKAFG